MKRKDKAYSWIHRNIVDPLSSGDTLIRKANIHSGTLDDFGKFRDKNLESTKSADKEFLKSRKRFFELHKTLIDRSKSGKLKVKNTLSKSRVDNINKTNKRIMDVINS